MAVPSDLIKSGGTVDIGGETYILDELTTKDYIEIEAVIRDMRPNPAETALAVARGMDRDDPLREKLVREAIDKQGKAGLVSAEEVDEFRWTPMGMFHFMWRMMRHSRPEMTLEDAMSLIEQLGQECAEAFIAEHDGMPAKNSLSPDEILERFLDLSRGSTSTANSVGQTDTPMTPSGT